VDDIEPEQQRNMQARLQRQRLHPARLGRAADVQHGADPALAEGCHSRGRPVGGIA